MMDTNLTSTALHHITGVMLYNNLITCALLTPCTIPASALLRPLRQGVIILWRYEVEVEVRAATVTG